MPSHSKLSHVPPTGGRAVWPSCPFVVLSVVLRSLFLDSIFPLHCSSPHPTSLLLYHVPFISSLGRQKIRDLSAFLLFHWRYPFLQFLLLILLVLLLLLGRLPSRLISSRWHLTPYNVWLQCYWLMLLLAASESRSAESGRENGASPFRWGRVCGVVYCFPLSGPSRCPTTATAGNGRRQRNLDRRIPMNGHRSTESTIVC